MLPIPLIVYTTEFSFQVFSVVPGRGNTLTDNLKNVDACLRLFVSFCFYCVKRSQQKGPDFSTELL